jgi:hypothetical protein
MAADHIIRAVETHGVMVSGQLCDVRITETPRKCADVRDLRTVCTPIPDNGKRLRNDLPRCRSRCAVPADRVSNHGDVGTAMPDDRLPAWGGVRRFVPDETVGSGAGQADLSWLRAYRTACPR